MVIVYLWFTKYQLQVKTDRIYTIFTRLSYYASISLVIKDLVYEVKAKAKDIKFFQSQHQGQLRVTITSQNLHCSNRERIYCKRNDL